MTSHCSSISLELYQGLKYYPWRWFSGRYTVVSNWHINILLGHSNIHSRATFPAYGAWFCVNKPWARGLLNTGQGGLEISSWMNVPLWRAGLSCFLLHNGNQFCMIYDSSGPWLGNNQTVRQNNNWGTVLPFLHFKVSRVSKQRNGTEHKLSGLFTVMMIRRYILEYFCRPKHFI